MAHSSRFPARLFTTAVRGIAAIGCRFGCYPLKSCRSGRLSFSAEVDPERTLDVVLSAIELGLTDGEGKRTINAICDGSSGLDHFGDIAGLIAKRR